VTEIQWRYDDSGRIQPTHFGHMLHPATCLLCSRIGKAPEEVFANLGVDLEFYGMVYLCLDCCAEVAGFIKFVSTDRFDTLQEQVGLLSDRNSKLLLQLDEARRLVDVRIDNAGDSLFDSDVDASVPVPASDGATDSIDRLLNDNEPEFAKSGKK
jgi:hypothetical protein